LRKFKEKVNAIRNCTKSDKKKKNWAE